MVRDAAQAYAQDKLAPRVLNAFRNEQTDPAIFSEMGELGLLGATIPAEYGGAGLNYVSYGLIAREVERVDSGYRSMMSVQSSLVMVPINEFGSEAQKQKYLPAGLRRMDRLLRPDRAQPRFRPRRHGNARGQDRRRLQADRQQDVDHQLPIADVFVVWAKCVGGDFDGKIRGFILDKGMKGLSAPAIHGKVGLRASITGEIVMDEVEVSAEQMMPGVAGLKGPSPA